MPRGRHWYQREPAAFIMATRGFELEVVGAYSLIIDHLNDRDRPLPNDDKFMAGLLHCSTQRWRKIRDQLVRRGKIHITADDYISNPRFEREQEERGQDRARSVEHGRQGGLISAARRAGQTELPMAEPQPSPPARAHTGRNQKSHKVAKDRPDLSQKIANSSTRSLRGTVEPNAQNQPLGPTPPSSTVRAQESESEKERLSHPTNGTTPVRARARGQPDPTDLHGLYAAVLDAAGVTFTTPEAIERAMTQVARWRDDGIDFNAVVLPTIRQLVLTTDAPTRTLGRFNRDVQHQWAKRRAAVANGKPYASPEIPILSPDGEDPAFLSLRTDLLDALGPDAYAQSFNRIRFEAVTDCFADKHPIRLTGPDHLLEHLRHGGRYAAQLRRASRAHGFTDVW